MIRRARWVRRLRAGIVLALCGGAVQFSGCMDSEIMKRFREAYAPGLVEGLTTALAAPGDAEEGLRRTATAFAEGLGAVIEPRTPAPSSGSSGSSNTGSSSSGR